jgi:hypothetical protein
VVGVDEKRVEAIDPLNPLGDSNSGRDTQQMDQPTAFVVAVWIVSFVGWIVCTAVGGIAPADRPTASALLTFFILGPIGVAAAAIAQPTEIPKADPPERRPVADGRRRFTGPRCGAENDIPEADTSYDCPIPAPMG